MYRKKAYYFAKVANLKKLPINKLNRKFLIIG